MVLYLDFCESLASQHLSALMAGNPTWGTTVFGDRYVSEFFGADPIMQMASLFYKKHKVQRYVSKRTENKSSHTIPAKNPIIGGFRVLAQRSRKKVEFVYSKAFPKWNGYLSTQLHGKTSWTNSPSVPVLSNFLTYVNPAEINSEKIYITKLAYGASFQDHISFADLVNFASRLRPYIGRAFQVNSTLGRSCSHVLGELDVSDNMISYTLQGIYNQGYPSGRNLRCNSVRVSIIGPGTAVDSIAEISVLISGMDSAWLDNKTWLTPVWKVRSYAGFSNREPTNGKRVTAISMIHDHALDFPLKYFAPGIYITQSLAASKVMPDYSRNFENFVELPETAKLFKQLNDLDSNTVRKYFGKQVPPSERMRNMTRLLSGTFLTNAFAISPTLKAIAGLAQPLVLPLKGEGSFKLSGTSSDSLPEALRFKLQRNLLFAGLPDTVVQYDLTVRSEVRICPTYQSAALAFLESNPILYYGLVPTPLGVFQVGQMSFVVDWWLRISDLIKQHQTYFLSALIPLRVGHSVDFSYRLSNGLWASYFIRSKEEDYLIDPPGVSWLQNQQLPSVSIPLVLSMLLGSYEGVRVPI
jgi:hypothetical protein